MSVDNTVTAKTEDVATVEYSAPSFGIHTFVATICDIDVQFQIFKMDGSLLIWIGSLAEPTFQDLTLAMKTRYDALPLTTKLLGEGVDMVSSNLASKLVKKLGKPVYVSFNLPMDKIILPGIEQRLTEEIQLYPDKFD
ncbi:hypothetical protein R5R35_004537 [Gryllus longicercus]|uniref:Proteasome assembly chaperone 4 n=1 Tax=Gryllus longicercus TaxID=2509291 RepID=A0AAN9ZFP2_9ORTH